MDLPRIFRKNYFESTIVRNVKKMIHEIYLRKLFLLKEMKLENQFQNFTTG